MSSWKTCSAIIVINIFLLWIASFTVELYSLINKIENVNNTLPTSIESALNTALQSEEMFGNGSANFDSRTGRQQNIVYYNGDEWINANIYSLARACYPSNGGFDTLAIHQLLNSSYSDAVDNSDIDTSDSDKSFCELYAWAFSEDGAVFERADKTPKYEIQNVPNSYFQNFYNTIGKYYLTRGYKLQSDSSGFITKQEWAKYPTLEQTGYDLEEDVNKSVVRNDASGSKFWYVQDGESVAKAGKVHVYKHDGNTGGNKATGTEQSTYMLTPYSLGITYLDPRVTKTVIAANIIKTMQLQALDIGASNASVEKALDNSIGNIQIGDSELQTVYESSITVNNGQFEVDVDLDNIDVNIEYANVNFFDEDNNGLVNKIQGYVPGTSATNNNTETVTKLMEKNTAKLYKESPSKRIVEDKSGTSGGTPKNDPERGNRVVAKVTVSLDLNIPYTTPFMRWIRGNLFKEGYTRVGKKAENHFGILRLALGNNDTAVANTDTINGVHVNPTKIVDSNRGYGEYNFSSDSLQYQYTTYVAITD